MNKVNVSIRSRKRWLPELYLRQVFSVNPIFGVDFSLEDKPQSLASVTVERSSDDVEIVDEEEDHADVLACYYADGTQILCSFARTMIRKWYQRVP